MNPNIIISIESESDAHNIDNIYVFHAMIDLFQVQLLPKLLQIIIFDCDVRLFVRKQIQLPLNDPRRANANKTHTRTLFRAKTDNQLTNQLQPALFLLQRRKPYSL